LPLLVATQRVGLPGWIAALLAARKVNQSERRPALYTALRQADDTPLVVDGRNIIPDIRARSGKMRMLAAQIRGGCASAPPAGPFRAVVNLGIGGSDLGAFLVCSALAQPPRARGSTGPQTQASTSRSSPMSIPSTDARARAARSGATLFLVTSKSFITQETLANAASAKAWLVARTRQRRQRQFAFHGDDGESRSRAGRSASPPPTSSRGGTGSAALLPVVSAGMPIALKLGWERFEKLLAGAASVDAHFREAPLERNLPVLLGLVGWWNATHLKHVGAGRRSLRASVVPACRLSAAARPRKPGQARRARRRRADRAHSRRYGAKSGATASTRSSSGCTRVRAKHRSSSSCRSHATHPSGNQQTLLVANAPALGAGR
jgi:glucose-6-phosphate isomerase